MAALRDIQIGNHIADIFCESSNESFEGFTTSDIEDDMPLARLLYRHETSGSEVGSDFEISDTDSEDDTGPEPPLPAGRNDIDRGADRDNDVWTHEIETRDDIDFDQENVRITQECRNMSVLQLFQLFFTGAVMNLIVTETNRYATQQRSAKANGPKWDWPETGITVEHLEVFLGLTIAMGLVDKKGSFKDYWSNFWLTKLPAFGATMPRDMFCQIMRYLHFTNNSTAQTDRYHQNYDKLWKIRKL
ncbi:uncharacterized protein LOC144436091 [Glandiceps talaboti]